METRSNHILVGGVVLGSARRRHRLHHLDLAGRRQAGQALRHLLRARPWTASPRAARSPSPACRSARSNRSASQPQTPELVRVRITVTQRRRRSSSGPPPSIKGVGFTGVSQIQLDPPDARPAAAARAAEIVCPDDAEPALPLWRAGHPDQAGRPRRRSSTARRNCSNRVSTLTEQLTELLVEPQPEFDRRHPRERQGDQQEPRRPLRRDRRDHG